MIFDVTGDLLADGCQIKQLVFDERIVGPISNFPVDGAGAAGGLDHDVSSSDGLQKFAVIQV